MIYPPLPHSLLLFIFYLVTFVGIWDNILFLYPHTLSYTIRLYPYMLTVLLREVPMPLSSILEFPSLFCSCWFWERSYNFFRPTHCSPLSPRRSNFQPAKWNKLPSLLLLRIKLFLDSKSFLRSSERYLHDKLHCHQPAPRREGDELLHDHSFIQVPQAPPSTSKLIATVLTSSRNQCAYFLYHLSYIP